MKIKAKVTYAIKYTKKEQKILKSIIQKVQESGGYSVSFDAQERDFAEFYIAQLIQNRKENDQMFY